MAHQQITKKVASLGSYTISGANTIAFAPGKSVRVERVILVYTTANTAGQDVLTLQRRPVAGAAANQVTLGTWTMAAAIAAGQVRYLDLGDAVGQPTTGVDGSSVYAARGINNAIAAGQDFAIVSSGAGDAGVVNVYVEYFDDDQTAGTKVARTT